LPDIPSSEGVRTAKWKYFRYRLIKAPEELYDLEHDPLEKNNLAADIKYSKILAKLRKECDSTSLRYQREKLCPDEPFIEQKNF
jgi:arylsulfatase A-like enzyme